MLLQVTMEIDDVMLNGHHSKLEYMKLLTEVIEHAKNSPDMEIIYNHFISILSNPFICVYKDYELHKLRNFCMKLSKTTASMGF